MIRFTFYGKGAIFQSPTSEYRQRPAPAALLLATARPSRRGPGNAPPLRQRPSQHPAYTAARGAARTASASLTPPPSGPAGRGALRALPPRHPATAPRALLPIPAPRSRAPGADPAVEVRPGPPPAVPTRLLGLRRHKGKQQHV